MLNFFEDTFLNKKVLITGHSGFKGRWLCRVLKNLNSEVFGFSIDSIPVRDFGLSSKSQLIDKEYLEIRMKTIFDRYLSKEIKPVYKTINFDEIVKYLEFIGSRKTIGRIVALR